MLCRSDEREPGVREFQSCLSLSQRLRRMRKSIIYFSMLCKRKRGRMWWYNSSGDDIFVFVHFRTQRLESRHEPQMSLKTHRTKIPCYFSFLLVGHIFWMIQGNTQMKHNYHYICFLFYNYNIKYCLNVNKLKFLCFSITRKSFLKKWKYANGWKTYK